MIFTILSFLFYGVAAIPIITTNNTQRIVGGFDAYPGQFPYQALVRHSNNLEELCGGSIISNQWILTSGTCVISLGKPNKMRIVVGSIYLNSGGTTHTVLISIVHPDFDPYRDPLSNDIGLIRVNGQFSFNDFIQPIPLSSDSTSVGLPLTIAGWGAINNSIEVIPVSNTLQFITLKSISLNECKKLYNDIPQLQNFLTDLHVCTHVKNMQSLCSFDQGSPVVYNRQQHAVVSFPGGCYYGVPDVHTRILPFRSWIKDITNV